MSFYETLGAATADERAALLSAPIITAALAGQLKRESYLAFLSQANVHADVDRVVAVFADGRAYAWNQMNPSAEK